MRKTLLLVALLLALFTVPAFAQDDAQNEVSFNGFSFAFPSSLATNVNITQFTNVQDTFPTPADNTQFLLYSGYPAPEGIYDQVGGILVHDVADFEGNEAYTAQFEALQTLLSERPDLAQFEAASDNANDNALPYLPVLAAAQVIRARTQYVETAGFQGISYITIYRQDVSPLLGDEFIYTFQGISTDGTQYVAATFNLTTELFPAGIPTDFDVDAFTANFNEYLAESVSTLNDAAPEDFTPSLLELDSVIASFSTGETTGAAAGAVPAATVEPAPTAEATPNANAAGDLGGVVWTLVSYGDPEAPILALADAPVTAEFSGDGVTGSTGCNNYSAPFEYVETDITIGAAVVTRRACEDAVMAQEDAFLDALETTTTFTLTESQLQINYEGGVLVFVGASPTV